MEIKELSYSIKALNAEMHLYSHVLKKMKLGELTEDWYVGITGKNDDDNDGKSDRILGHRKTFLELDESSWEEYEINEEDSEKREKIALYVEKRMADLGFDVGGKIQAGSLPAKIIYTFKKGATDLRDKKNED